ncbi:SPOR domain-containing protein [Sphingomonas aracearum]|uniref:SPOR domain-containing protein n=1 Tax=Sphingomonas aracearum TaxID=2283317 RepID=A0A369VYG4_9SPHN|nr:SPOR domain-containing protein [Sphingomonas aracearum]RDE06667.1 SPOR domain-containing protein [Sphingomonas aracearum]
MAGSRDDFEMRDEDRLPWLETVEEDESDGPSVLRIVAAVLLGLGIVAALVFGWRAVSDLRGPAGDGTLIAAQEGDYKVRPETPGGMKVTGEGDTAIATSDGSGAGNASIDLAAVPEAPVEGKRAAAPKPSATAGAPRAEATVPASGGQLKARPVAAPLASSGGKGGGALVQLGSFPTEAAANTAWTRQSKRFSYLAPLGKEVVKAEVNGATTYRLRVNAGSSGAAQTLCGKLKVAGEGCFIPRD